MTEAASNNTSPGNLSAEFVQRGLDRHHAEVFAQRLDAFLSAGNLPDRVDSFVEMIQSAQVGHAPSAEETSPLEALIGVLESSPGLRTRVQTAIGLIIAETSGVGIFGEAGLPNERGFTSEFFDRLLDLVLPKPRDDRELGKLLLRLMHSRREIERFREMPEPIFRRMFDVLTPADQPAMWAPIRFAFADGFRLLAARVQGHGLAEALRKRSHPVRVSASPFFRISRESDALLSAWTNNATLKDEIAAWRKTCTSCRGEMAEISRRLETDGVSVDIVYGLDVLEICLSRMELMVNIIETPPGPDLARKIHLLLANLTEASYRDQSLKYLVRSSTRLLHRKIVDRSGEVGEHYIASSKSEYRQIWLAAAGGGILTAFTAAMKVIVTHSHLPLFLEGFFSGLNYAVSFLILQAFGFVLATKQPAMTAATLATIMRDNEGVERSRKVIDLAARICRSQIAAAVSNVIVVFATAYAFNELWKVVLHHAYVETKVAKETFETLSPFDSGTIFYAALTGVLLYLGSLAGGWLENWSVYHRLPLAFREHGVGRLVGRERVERFSRFYMHNVAGWGTNVALGFLLGMTPVMGKFVGIPLDVRHVTLSTGLLALAAAGIDANLFEVHIFLRATLGIATMFVLNLSVSFALSFVNAARAYEVDSQDLLSMAKELFHHIRKAPRDFLFPPKGEPEVVEGQH